MNPTILIRTYAKDAQWLAWALLSCRQQVPALPIVVVCPCDEGREVKQVTDKFDVTLHGAEPHHRDGYLDQQWTKLHADRYCPDADYIIHMDSDCIWTDGWESLFREDRPVMLKTPYADLAGSGAEAWKGITERALGFGVEFEFMRRMPLVYPRWVYKSVRIHLCDKHEVDFLGNWFEKIPSRELSEFNVLGAWCHENRPEVFHWIDTSKEPLPDTVMRQGWSWGGMTPEVKAEWRTYVDNS